MLSKQINSYLLTYCKVSCRFLPYALPVSFIFYRPFFKVVFFPDVFLIVHVTPLLFIISLNRERTPTFSLDLYFYCGGASWSLSFAVELSNVTWFLQTSLEESTWRNKKKNNNISTDRHYPVIWTPMIWIWLWTIELT